MISNTELVSILPQLNSFARTLTKKYRSICYEDLVQEAVVELLTYDNYTNPLVLAYSRMQNYIRNELKEQKKFKPIEDTGTSNFSDVLVEINLWGLTEEEKFLLNGFYFEGYSKEEIARKLQITKKTINNKLRRLKRKIEHEYIR